MVEKLTDLSATKFTARLTSYLKSGFPGIMISSAEEARVLADVISSAKAAKRAVAVWSATEGLRDLSNGGRAVPDSEDLQAVCRQAMKLENIVIVLCDVAGWPLDRDPILELTAMNETLRDPTLSQQINILRGLVNRVRDAKEMGDGGAASVGIIPQLEAMGVSLQQGLEEAVAAAEERLTAVGKRRIEVA